MVTGVKAAASMKCCWESGYTSKDDKDAHGDDVLGGRLKGGGRLGASKQCMQFVANRVTCRQRDVHSQVSMNACLTFLRHCRADDADRHSSHLGLQSRARRSPKKQTMKPMWGNFSNNCFHMALHIGSK